MGSYRSNCFSKENIDEEEEMTVEVEQEVFDDSSSAGETDSDLDINLFETLDFEEDEDE